MDRISTTLASSMIERGDQMPVAWQFHTIEPYLEVRLSGKLRREEFEGLEPRFEQLLREEGPLRVLCVLHDFHGWTAGGAWEEIKFDVRHFDDVHRLAIVGETRWHESLAGACRWLTTAEVRYFTRDELDDARDWLLQVPAQVAGANRVQA
jgi:hypothetical protein